VPPCVNDAPHTPASKYCFGTTTADIVTTSVLGPTKGSALQIDHVDSTKYYYPKASNHRAFESMCVAKSDDGVREVLCLFQSKINADVAGAIDALNQAADELAELWDGPTKTFLFIVFALDASPEANLSAARHPILFVHRQNLNDYFTATLAPAAELCWIRHKQHTSNSASASTTVC